MTGGSESDKLKKQLLEQALTPALAVTKHFFVRHRTGEIFMLENNGSKQQGRELYQPLLFMPGEQGWKTPKPNELLLPKACTKRNTLTTKQLQKQLGVSHDVLRTCPMGAVLPLNTYLIWHQGRNSWKLYEEKLMG